VEKGDMGMERGDLKGRRGRVMRGGGSGRGKE